MYAYTGQSITNDNPIHILNNSLTTFGKRFVHYVLDPLD